MKKSFNVKPVNEIELVFEDGKSILLKFDVQALLNFSNLDNGINSLVNEKSLTEMCAKIVYIAGASYNEGLGLEEARKIVSNMNFLSLAEIVNEFNESMGVTQNEVQADFQKKLMAQFLQNLK